MLRIRQEQLDAMRNASVSEFEAKMVAHVRRFFPFDCASLGEDGVRETVSFAVERADRRGFTTERDVTKFVNLMYTFGRGFESLPWAQEVFREPAPHSMDRLYELGLAHAEEARGISAAR